MDFDGVGWIFSLLLQWRVALCLAASSGAAILLVQLFPWLSGLQGIAIALLGAVPAAMWEASRQAPPPVPAQASAPETSLPVAALAAVLAGATWGAISAGSMHSFMAGLVIFLLASGGWSWFHGNVAPLADSGRRHLCIVLAGLAYPLASLLAHQMF